MSMWDEITEPYNANLAMLTANPDLAEKEMERRRKLHHAPGCACQCRDGETCGGLMAGVSCKDLRRILCAAGRWEKAQ
jgi:hypothetical protein